MRNHYDVAIIGAGPAGAVAAIAYARRGARVLLVEANPAAASRFAGEWLHPPGVSVLESLGLLPIEPASAHGAGRGMVVFPDDGDEPIRLPYPDGTTGLSCDHREFVGALRDRAAGLKEVDFLSYARVVGIKPGRLIVRTRETRVFEVSADLIVGAEGRNSISRTYLGLADGSVPLSHMAGVELRDVELPFEGYGHVILGGPGPILLYRIGPGRARACLDLPIERCPRRRDTALLWRSFRSVLPAATVPAFREALLANRVIWTTTRFRSRSLYGRGDLALIGDAVGFFHPLTATGMTLGLHDAVLLAGSRNVDEYRQQRERQCYVAELLSMALYRVMSREDASTESIRTAIYRMWGESELERTRTMRMLISEDYRSASFAAAFLKVAVGAVKHLVWSNPAGDWRRPFPALLDTLSLPRTLLQWPAALLLSRLIETPARSLGVWRPPTRHLRLIKPPVSVRSTELPPTSSPGPSELNVRVALASAFGALADVLMASASVASAPSTTADLELTCRVIQSLSRSQRHIEDGPDISAALASCRKQLAACLAGLKLDSRIGGDPWLAEAALALVTDSDLDHQAVRALCAAVEGVLQLQQPSGGFRDPRARRSRRWLTRVRRETQADVLMTSLCCRALAAVRRQHPGLLIDRVPMALARARTWLADRQKPTGFWASANGHPSVEVSAGAVDALLQSGMPTTARPLRRAARWLCELQSTAGTWSAPGIPPSTLTPQVVRGLIAARPLEVDAIERGVGALLDPGDWNAGTNPDLRCLCAIAEGLAAFLDWSQDIPTSIPVREARVALGSRRRTPMRSSSEVEA